MSLATRCPYCRTTFRVAHDQLKLRGGLVRCGACKEIFNGVEQLLPATPVDAPLTRPLAPSPAASPAQSAPASAAPEAAGDTQVFSPAPLSNPDGDSGSPSGAIAREPVLPDASPDAIARTAEQANRSDGPHDHEQTVANEPLDAHTGSGWPEPAARPGSESPTDSPADDATAGTDMAGMGQDAQHPHQSAHDQRDEADATSPIGHRSAATDQEADPLTRMTLMDIRPDPEQHARPATAAHALRAHADNDEIGRAIEDLQSKPWRGSQNTSQSGLDEIDALDGDEPDFVRKAKRQQQRAHRMQTLLAAGCGMLLVGAILQGLIAFRTTLAAQWPATRPALTQLCSAFGCSVGMPEQIEHVTIESTELQALPASDNSFLLSTLLRNRSNVVQAWPHLELTLNDAGDQPVARRVFSPAEYLPPQDRSRGFQPSSEKPVRLSFALTQLKASGYRLYVFYP